MSNALGIDLGSSKVAAVVIDEDAKIVDSVSILLPDRAEAETVVERDPKAILLAVETAVKSLNTEARSSIDVIGVCGQMHGVILWNDLDQDHSPLITWEDRRADEGTFLNDLRDKTGRRDVHSGFGTVTLAWLKENDPSQLLNYQYAGTIMDYLVSRLCDEPEPKIDPTNAAGWGFFDNRERAWDLDAFAKTEVSTNLLPSLCSTGDRAGTICASLAEAWGLPDGVAVAVACGDSPAAVFSCREHLETGVFINIGTGSQLAVVVEESALAGIEDDIGIEIRPFLPGRFLAVAVSVCGGKSFQWLVETVETWCRELNVEPPGRDRLYSLLNDLGESCTEAELPKFLPFFKEERHHPGTPGSISGIGWSNLSLGSLAKSLSRGMVECLWEPFPPKLLEGKTTLIATGNGLRRSPLLRSAAVEVVGLPITVPDLCEEAATGAARIARHFLRTS